MFRNRFDAGLQLSTLLGDYAKEEVSLLAIPRGGIEVGHPIALHLKKALDVIIPRKLPCPDNPELAVGAVTLDGSIEINYELMAELDLTPADVETLIEPVQTEIKRRLAIYRGDRRPPDLSGKNVILIDDGLATGYTMMAAIKSVRRDSPKRVVVAVPVSPASTYERLRKLADEVLVIHLAQDRLFAVSAFYDDFHDLSDGELVQLLRETQRDFSERAGVSG